MTDALKTPWLKSLGPLPAHIEYFKGTMFEAVENAAQRRPDLAALDFMGRSVSYGELAANIRRCAAGLRSLSIRKGDTVTIALPNCPQAVYALYAVNLIGAVANMVHLLSSENEMFFFLENSKSSAVIILDSSLDRFSEAFLKAGTGKIIITSIADELSALKRLGYKITNGRKAKKPPKTPDLIRWRDLMAVGGGAVPSKQSHDDTAVILYSGGTTGKTKGILLSNFNFNALAAQIAASNPMFAPGDVMLAAMPMFHGFGLGVCIHSMLANGCRCVLVLRFSPKDYAALITKYRCSFIAGVPSIFEALLRLPCLDHADLSCLKGVFSGGDAMPPELKRRFDEFLSAHGASVQIREGYGTTETVTACCLTPPHMSKEGSIGLPFPDTFIRIVRPDSDEELPLGEEGEILLSGPTVMKGYAESVTGVTELPVHADGLRWVRTGDIGMMDSDGFLYFRGRIKRMIVSSGYNIYPSQLENILDSHPSVQMSCVVGVPDPYRMQRVKAFIVPKDGVTADDALRRDITVFCEKNMAKYAMPREIAFRRALPMTPVGKIDYRELEKE